MPTRSDTPDSQTDGLIELKRGETDLTPSYDEQWPGWVLRARRQRWTAVPVLELAALLLCLAAIISLSRLDTLPASQQTSPLYAPAGESD